MLLGFSSATSRRVFFGPIVSSHVRMLSLGGSHLLRGFPIFCSRRFWFGRNWRRPSRKNRHPCRRSRDRHALPAARQRSDLILEQRTRRSLSAKNRVGSCRKSLLFERGRCLSSRAMNPGKWPSARSLDYRRLSQARQRPGGRPKHRPTTKCSSHASGKMLAPGHEPGEDNPSARIRPDIALGGFAAALRSFGRRLACRSARRCAAAAAFDRQ